MDHTIDVLTKEHWREYKKLRLESLEKDPTAYGSSYEEEVIFSEDEWKKKFDRGTTYGAFVDGSYVGILSVMFETKIKMDHTVDIVGFYVMPEYRGRGIGRALMERAIADLYANPKIIKLRLGVNVLQQSAIKLYQDLGFQTKCIIEKATKMNGMYYDHARMELIFEDKV